jgi:hypothetical protein
VAASDDFAVSTEDAVTHQECPFITSNICMQGAQHLEKKEEILSCFWRLHHILFTVTLYLLEPTEKLPARAVWRATYWSYLMTICRSNVTR